jgi:hypothetical protein
LSPTQVDKRSQMSLTDLKCGNAQRQSRVVRLYDELGSA